MSKQSAGLARLGASVTVVIPFYQRQDTITDALNSVFQQSLAPCEVIVVDDASGGDAVAFLEQFEPDITVISLADNVGVSEARNIGVRAASGDYIAFLDSDDSWERDKLARQFEYLESHHDSDAVHTGIRIKYSDGGTVDYIDKPKRLEKEDLVKSSQVMIQSLMMRRDDFLKLGGFDRSFRQSEDYEFSMRMVTHGMKIDFLPEPLVILNRGRSDHLSSDWKGYLVGHIRIVSRYSGVFQEVDGFFSPCKYTGKYLINGGTKRGGLIGRMVAFVGLAIYTVFK